MCSERRHSLGCSNPRALALFLHLRKIQFMQNLFKKAHGYFQRNRSRLLLRKKPASGDPVALNKIEVKIAGI
jgi:hypothetical protein